MSEKVQSTGTPLATLFSSQSSYFLIFFPHLTNFPPLILPSTPFLYFPSVLFPSFSSSKPNNLFPSYFLLHFSLFPLQNLSFFLPLKTISFLPIPTKDPSCIFSTYTFTRLPFLPFLLCISNHKHITHFLYLSHHRWLLRHIYRRVLGVLSPRGR